jgi:predicted TIM-barrel fold metal-dependent hydrolase
MRIDAHIHYTPPEMARDLANFSEQEPYWGLLLAQEPGTRSLQGWVTAGRMIEDMDRAGIDRVVIMGEYRQRHETSVARNDQSLEIIKRWPDRTIAFACIQPKAGPQALDELKRCLDGGMLGVGESNPYGQGHTLEDPDFLRLVEACIQYNVPLNLHVSEEVGHFYPGKSTTPLRHYYELACRYPELKLVLAHWGGGLFFYEIMPEVRRKLQNVWYDTAASPLLYPTGTIFKVALQSIDPRKILYASDYPLLVYPSKQREPDFRPFIAEIDALGLSPATYADIMGENAARLFGLAEPGAAGETDRPAGRSSRPSPIITEIPDKTGVQIGAFMAVRTVAELWPETRTVFDKHGIPWQDTAVPFWEPVVQAAAARGYNAQARQRLLDELNEAIS